MTFVKFDPEGVQALINNLYAYVEDTDEGRSAIYWASDDRDHPVPTVEEMTSAPALYSCAPADGVSATTMGNAAAILLGVADDLAARRREIIDLNSSGVTAAAPDGRLTYYLPDDAEDTITNLRSYNTQAATAAGADAAALTQAKDSENGTADDGRTTDQILTDITKYQDNPVYGKMLVDGVGAPRPTWTWSRISTTTTAMTTTAMTPRGVSRSPPRRWGVCWPPRAGRTRAAGLWPRTSTG